MNRKWAPYIIIGVLLIILIVVKLFTKENDGPDTKRRGRVPEPQVNRNWGFDRRITFIEYSEHALCRMKCRNISKEEVIQIMQEGKINYRKSEIRNARCPRYALEGVTKDGQKVRIIFAQCHKKTVVVTAIDLEVEYTCHCPGDEKIKKKTR